MSGVATRKEKNYVASSLLNSLWKEGSKKVKVAAKQEKKLVQRKYYYVPAGGREIFHKRLLCLQ